MAEQKKPTRERLLTPKGVAVYPRITEPDTKFNADGLYQIRLRMSVADGQELMTKLDTMTDEKFAEVVAENGGKTFKIVKGKKTEFVRNEPYTLVLDDDGNETGEVEFKFKMYAKVKSKDGSSRTQRPTLVDGKGKEIKKKIAVYGGSIVKINFTPSTYSQTIGIGVTCYLNAVQILKLVSGSGGNHGFEADEDAEYSFEDDDSGFDDDDDNDGDGSSEEDGDTEF
jgi:hypothetical protein